MSYHCIDIYTYVLSVLSVYFNVKLFIWGSPAMKCEMALRSGQEANAQVGNSGKNHLF